MEELITRENLKQRLEAIGINYRLLQMPSVLERVYERYKGNGKLEEGIFNGEIEVFDNGDFSLKGREGFYSFKFDKKNNTAELRMQRPELTDKIIYIDKYGMDSVVEILSSSISDMMGVPDGKRITRFEEFNILKYEGYGYGHMREFKKIWNQNREFLLQNYTITQGWFEKRESLRNDIEKKEENDVFAIEYTDYEPSEEIKNSRKVLADATERIAQLTRANEEKDSKIEMLEKDKNNLQSMLKRTLQLCEEVKRSWVGKVFFRSQLKQLNESQDEERLD